jgi:hypothetical protein
LDLGSGFVGEDRDCEVLGKVEIVVVGIKRIVPPILPRLHHPTPLLLPNIRKQNNRKVIITLPRILNRLRKIRTFIQTPRIVPVPVELLPCCLVRITPELTICVAHIASPIHLENPEPERGIAGRLAFELLSVEVERLAVVPIEIVAGRALGAARALFAVFGAGEADVFSDREYGLGGVGQGDVLRDSRGDVVADIALFEAGLEAGGGGVEGQVLGGGAGADVDALEFFGLDVVRNFFVGFGCGVALIHTRSRNRIKIRNLWRT